jgi:hypothetical protein
MGGSQEEKGTPPPVVKAMVTLATLRFAYSHCYFAPLTFSQRVGMKAMVEKVHASTAFEDPT